MARDDGLMEYLKHTGSALFAVPPGVGEGEYVGQSLFAQTSLTRPASTQNRSGHPDRLEERLVVADHDQGAA